MYKSLRSLDTLHTQLALVVVIGIQPGFQLCDFEEVKAIGQTNMNEPLKYVGGDI